MNFTRLLAAALAILAFREIASAAQNGAIVLTSTSHHLRSGTNAEWEEFSAKQPEGRRLDLRFVAEPNAAEATLFVRQDDVRHDWSVDLNGKRLGKLFLMEADLVHTLRVPAQTLKAGSNVLSIVPPSRDNDDIFIRSLVLDPRPIAAASGEATLAVAVRDSNGKPMPGRVTVVSANGAMAPLLVLSNAPLAAVRPGVVYTMGETRVGLPSGDYTLYASRGFEWSVATQRVHVARGKVVEVAFTLKQEVDTAGYVSCDTHVHTLTHSKHGDATTEERIITLAGEGIELPVATEHNLHVEYATAARAMNASRWFTPVPGNEVTTPAGHFNIFPVHPSARVPDYKVTDWEKLMPALRETPDVRVVILNHPRNVHNGFQPFAATNFDNVTGENKRGPEFSFDAMEVLNSSAQQSDYMLVYRDWFALLNHGYRVTGVGSSDGHDVSRYIVGQGRTYIRTVDDRPGAIDIAGACSNLVAGRALVSMGLLVELTVDGKFTAGDLATGLSSEVTIAARIQGPSWITATNVTLFANGQKVREQALANIHRETITWRMPRPAHDVHLVAIATGPGVTAPVWAIPRPYQPTSPRWEGRVVGSTNPIWVDGDRDGKFTSARAYARQLLAKQGPNAAAIAAARNEYDEAVLAQLRGLMK
jgi:hypothetical protein